MAITRDVGAIDEGGDPDRAGTWRGGARAGPDHGAVAAAHWRPTGAGRRTRRPACRDPDLGRRRSDPWRTPRRDASRRNARKVRRDAPFPGSRALALARPGAPHCDRDVALHRTGPRHHGGRGARPDPAEALTRRRLRRPVERRGRHRPVCRGATAGRRALRTGHTGPCPGGGRGRCPATRPAELRRARGRGGHCGLASGPARRSRRQGRGTGRVPLGCRGGDQFRPARSRRTRLADRDQQDQHRSP